MKRLILTALTGSAIATSAGAATLYSNDFGANDGGFTVSNAAITPANGFAYSTGVWNLAGEGNLGAPSSSALVSPPISVTATGLVTLSVDHRYSFEFDGTRWDGGQIQLSVNGGAFAAVPNSAFTANGYAGVIAGNNALTGTLAFNDNSAGYATPAFITSTADLGSFNAGDTLNVRFLAAYDEFATASVPGWEITSVTVNRVPEPAAAVSGLLGLAALGLRRRR